MSHLYIMGVGEGGREGNPTCIRVERRWSSSEEMMIGLLGIIQVTDSWQLGWVRLPSYWMNSVMVETREVRDTDWRLVPDPQ